MQQDRSVVLSLNVPQPPTWFGRLRSTYGTIVIFGLLVAAILGPAGATLAQPARVTEYRIKTAYLYHFSRYVTWPPGAFQGSKTPFVIGVIGDDPLGAALDEVAKRKTVNGRPIVIRRYKTWKNFQPCHILFVSKTAPADLQKQAIARTAGFSLLVGESPGFATRGAPVNFYLDTDGTIGFEINVDATTQRRLRVDARLLKLARVVRTRPQPGGDG